MLAPAVMLTLPASAEAVWIAPARLPEERFGSALAWDGAHAYFFGGSNDTVGGRVLRYDAESETATLLESAVPSGRTSMAAVWAERYVYLFGGLERSTINGSYTNFDEILRFDPLTDSMTVMSARLPTPRSGMSAIWDGNAIYLFGGESRGPYAATADIVRYDPATDSVVTMTAQLPKPASLTGAVWDGRYAYIFGGVLSVYYRADILRYDPTSDTLVTLPVALPMSLAGMATAWDGSRAYLFGGGSSSRAESRIIMFDPSSATVSVAPVTLLYPTAGAKAVWYGTKAIVFGGFAQPKPDQDAVFKGIQFYRPTGPVATQLDSPLPTTLSLATAVWSGSYAYIFWGNPGRVIQFEPATGNAVQLAPTIPGRHFEATAVWDGARAVIFGGGSGQISYFSPESDSAGVANAVLPVRLMAPSAAMVGGYIYVLGGEGSSAIFRYDPHQDTVTTMGATLPEPRSHAGVVSDGRHVYLIGGVSDRYLDDIIRYDPIADTVTAMRATLPTPRALAVTVWDGTKAIIAGGQGAEAAISNEIVSYNPAEDVMTVDMRALPAARTGATGVWDGNNTYLFGGIRCCDNGVSDTRDIIRIGDAPTRANLPPSAPRTTDGNAPDRAQGLRPGGDAAQPEQLNTLAPTLSWDPAPGATRYAVSIRHGNATQGELIDVTSAPGRSRDLMTWTDVGTATSYTVPSGMLSKDITYRWGVLTSNDAGDGPRSSDVFFNVPSAAPTTNSAPRCERIVPSETITLQIGKETTFSATCTDPERSSGRGEWYEDGDALDPIEPLGAGSTWSLSRKFSWASPGRHTLLTGAIDAAGALSNPIYWNVTVSESPPSAPTLAWTTPPPSAIDSGASFRIEWATTGVTSTEHLNIQWDLTDPTSGSCCRDTMEGAVSSSTRALTRSPITITAPVVPVTTVVKYVVHARFNHDETDIFSRVVSVTIRASDHPSIKPATGSGALPSPLILAGAVWANGEAYVFGGGDGSNWSAAILRYSPATRTVERMTAELPSGTPGIASVWTGTKILIFGVGNTILIYDPSSDTITTSSATLPTRSSHPAAIWDGHAAYVFGGFDERGLPMPSIVKYDPAFDRVTMMSAKLPSARGGASAAWDGHAAYVFGGSTPAGGTNEIVRYDPVNDQVTALPDRLPNAAYYTSALWNGSNFLVFGGFERGAIQYRPGSPPETPRAAKLLSLAMAPAAVWTGERALLFGGGPPASDAIVIYDSSEADQTKSPKSGALRMVITSRPDEITQGKANWEGRVVNEGLIASGALTLELRSISSVIGVTELDDVRIANIDPGESATFHLQAPNRFGFVSYQLDLVGAGGDLYVREQGSTFIGGPVTRETPPVEIQGRPYTPIFHFDGTNLLPPPEIGTSPGDPATRLRQKDATGGFYFIGIALMDENGHPSRDWAVYEDFYWASAGVQIHDDLGKGGSPSGMDDAAWYPRMDAVVDARTSLFWADIASADTSLMLDEIVRLGTPYKATERMERHLTEFVYGPAPSEDPNTAADRRRFALFAESLGILATAIGVQGEVDLNSPNALVRLPGSMKDVSYKSYAGALSRLKKADFALGVADAFNERYVDATMEQVMVGECERARDELVLAVSRIVLIREFKAAMSPASLQQQEGYQQALGKVTDRVVGERDEVAAHVRYLCNIDDLVARLGTNVDGRGSLISLATLSAVGVVSVEVAADVAFDKLIHASAGAIGAGGFLSAVLIAGTLSDHVTNVRESYQNSVVAAEATLLVYETGFAELVADSIPRAALDGSAVRRASILEGARRAFTAQAEDSTAAIDESYFWGWFGPDTRQAHSLAEDERRAVEWGLRRWTKAITGELIGMGLTGQPATPADLHSSVVRYAIAQGEQAPSVRVGTVTQEGHSAPDAITLRVEGSCRVARGIDGPCDRVFARVIFQAADESVTTTDIRLAASTPLHTPLRAVIVPPVGTVETRIEINRCGEWTRPGVPTTSGVTIRVASSGATKSSFNRATWCIGMQSPADVLIETSEGSIGWDGQDVVATMAGANRFVDGHEKWYFLPVATIDRVQVTGSDDGTYTLTIANAAETNTETVIRLSNLSTSAGAVDSFVVATNGSVLEGLDFTTAHSAAFNVSITRGDANSSEISVGRALPAEAGVAFRVAATPKTSQSSIPNELSVFTPQSAHKLAIYAIEPGVVEGALVRLAVDIPHDIAWAFQWWIDGVPMGEGSDIIITAPSPGEHKVLVVARSADAESLVTATLNVMKAPTSATPTDAAEPAPATPTQRIEPAIPTTRGRFIPIVSAPLCLIGLALLALIKHRRR